MPIDPRAFQAELLQLLLRRLARLIQEMGDVNREPMPTCCAGPGPAQLLRGPYQHLLQQAQRAAEQGLGLDEVEAPAYVTAQLVRQLRTSSDEQRRRSMSLGEALGLERSSLAAA